jgi:hypothetical protein
MNIPLDEVIFFDCITTHPTTGAATDADSTPTFAVYEEATDTDIGVGGNLTKRASLTGNYRGTFTLSAANGFEVGKWYSIIGSATVNAIAGKGVLKNSRHRQSVRRLDRRGGQRYEREYALQPRPRSDTRHEYADSDSG